MSLKNGSVQKYFQINGRFKIADDPKPLDYVGLGDQIIVQYYGAESDEFILEIDRSGSILLPKIGQLTINGLKLEDARRLFAVG